MVPVRSAGAKASLDSAGKLFEQARAGIATITASAGELTAAAAKADAFDAAADSLLTRYRSTSFSAAAVPGAPAGLTNRLPLLLMVAALVIAALMGFVFYRARDFRPSHYWRASLKTQPQSPRVA